MKPHRNPAPRRGTWPRQAGDDIREELEQALGTYNLDELFYMIDSDQSGEASVQ